MARPVVTIVVPTYNEEDNIRTCLAALNNQSVTRDKYEVLVVDGGSKDRTWKLAEKFGADKVMMQKGKGIAGAKNTAACAARGKILASMDADVIAPSDWVEAILGRFSKKGVVAFAGVSSSIEQDFMSRLSLDSLAVFAKFCALVGRPLLAGQGSAVRLDVLKRVGGFIAGYNIVHDVEIGWRARRYGKIAFDSKWRVYTSSRRVKKMGFLKYFKLMAATAFAYWTKKKSSNVMYMKEEYTNSKK
ncbi:MAG: glycosyltransferase [Promethearchaeati archaeon SRVP18_Atabeyarchaeia-1]